MAPRSSRVRLDLNSPQFQDDFFALEAAELKQVVAALRRLRQMNGMGSTVIPGSTERLWITSRPRTERRPAPSGSAAKSVLSAIAMATFSGWSLSTRTTIQPTRVEAYSSARAGWRGRSRPASAGPPRRGRLSRPSDRLIGELSFGA